MLGAARCKAYQRLIANDLLWETTGQRGSQPGCVRVIFRDSGNSTRELSCGYSSPTDVGFGKGRQLSIPDPTVGSGELTLALETCHHQIFSIANRIEALGGSQSHWSPQHSLKKIEPLRALWGSNEAVRVLVVMPSNQGPKNMKL